MAQKTTSLRVKIFLAVISPIVFFGITELALRMVGYGHSTSFLQKKEFNGEEYYVANPHFTRPWFPGQNPRLPYPFGIPVHKAENSMRVLVLGASAAQGDPKPEFGFSRMLDRMLSGQFEDRKVEVYNLAVTAINSHVVKEIARDCSKLNADYWIIYLGNNEVIGPHGPANPGIQNNAMRKFLLVSRTGQCMENLLGRKRETLGWQGMESYLKPIQWKSRELEDVYAYFEKNLKRIIAHGQQAGATVLLSSVATNLRSCSPLNPVSPALDEWKAEQYTAARDEDTFRFRADSRINHIISNTAKEGNCVYIPADEEFQHREQTEQASLFYDHVHFTLQGNHILAGLIGNQILKLEKRETQPPKVNPTIGFTAFDKQGVLNIMRGRLQRPPFLKQQPNGLDSHELSSEIENLSIQLQPIEQIYLQAISAHPNDPILLLNYSNFLLTFNMANAARKHCEKATRLAPWNPLAFYNLALVQAATQSPLSAQESLYASLELSPLYSRAHALLGSLLTKSNPKKALYHFNESVRIEPDDPQVLISFAEHILKHSSSKKRELAKAYELSLHACNVSKFSNPQAVMLFSQVAKMGNMEKAAISALENAIDHSSDQGQKDALRKVIEGLK